MARIFVTGSAEGLGLMAAQLLVADQHEVILHARNQPRAADARAALGEAAEVIVGDLATIGGMRQVAQGANALGRFDAVIHNAGIGYRESRRQITDDGLNLMFAVNVLAPFVLTALIEMPDRLIYLSSGLHHQGIADLDDLQWERRPWNGLQAYSDTKLLDTVLAAAVARHRSDVMSNAVEPGWVATKMGGPDAPGDLSLGAVTQAWLAVSDDAEAKVSGEYFFHQQAMATHPSVQDHHVGDQLLNVCSQLSGVGLEADHR